MNAATRNLALIAATLGVDVSQLGDASPAISKVKTPSNGVRTDGQAVTSRYVTCSSCGAEPIRRFWKADPETGALKRVYEEPVAGGSITLHGCPSGAPRIASERANPLAKKLADGEASEFAISRAERRRQYNAARKLAKQA